MSSKKKPKFAHQKPTIQTKNRFSSGKVGYHEKYPEFSFKYYDSGHKTYSFKCIVDVNDFYKAFERFKSLSSLQWKQIKSSGNYHFHEIEWAETAEPKGFKKLPAYVRNFPPCQFKLFKECRIIGFFNENNIFEIVWIDRHHRVYSKKY